MKTFVALIMFSCLRLAPANWTTNLEDAKKMAAVENRFIILNFSGSDWCGPCIRMHKDLFESQVFEEFSGEKLVLVNADFPRLKKHQLSKEQQSINERTADQYNPTGIFPLTLLLKPDGTVIKKWEGLPNLSPEAFTDDIKTAIVNAMQ